MGLFKRFRGVFAEVPHRHTHGKLSESHADVALSGPLRGGAAYSSPR